MPEILNQDGTPAVLSPEDQAEVLRLAAEEPPTLTDPFKPLTYESQDGVEPTSAQKREIRKAANLVDPMLDLTPDEMVEFARNDPDKRFNILAAFQERQEEISKDPDAVDNIAQAWTKYKESTSLADLELGKIPENIWGFVKGAAKQVGTILWNYPKRILTEAPSSSVSDLWMPRDRTKIDPGASPANLEATRNLGEAAAASEAGLQGLAHMVEAKLKFGPPEKAKAPDWQNPEAAPRIRPATENPVVSLFGDVEKAKQLREIIEGAGPLSSPETVAKLKEAGFPIRPEEVEKMAAGDILSLHLFGKAFGAISHLTPGLTQAALKTAGKGTAIGVGKTIERTAKAAEWVVPKVAAAAPAAGAVKGALLGGSAGSPMAGAAAGLAVGKSFAKTLRGAMPKLADIESAGRQIAGTGGALPKGNLAQLIKDVAEAAPATAYEGGKGLFMDVVLAEGAETPEEVKGVGLGLAFGLVGGAGRMGGHVLSGQLIAPREWGKGTVTPSNKYFPGLDALHNEAITTAPDGVSARVNAVRAFVRAAVPNADFIFAGPKPKTGPDPLVAQLEKLGLSTEQATQWANTEGLFSKEINGHRLIVARDVAAAPHESFHALQDVLGESVNRQLDAVIQGDPKYAQFWDAYGREYALRLGWNPESGRTWQDHVLDTSKWGMAEAAELSARDTVQAVDADTGKPLTAQGPPSAEAMESALRYAKDNWRTILTPEQQAEVANRYVAREIGAENFDALFKRGVANDKTFTTKAVQLLGEVVRAMGGDPLAGRASDVSGYPLSADVVKAAGKQATAATAGKLPPGIAPGRTLPRGGMPTTPEQREDAAKEAQASADASADARLGVISKAIATGQVVVLNKLSAPDAPASDVFANRKVRRAQQEAGRSMPEDQKSLWFKAFVPERVLAISGGKYQVLGWAPEVFAANVQRTVRSIAEMMLADPTASRLSPYPIDPATKSLTPEGWRSLYADTQQQVQNYMAGRTGSGEPLVVPKFTAEKGIYAPSLQPGAPLEQPKADFISAMFGFKLPETPRITKGKLPLNVAGQDVSAATIPGRIVEPLNRRKPFTGEAAEKLGIQGREILEVNPWRAALEQSADALKVKMPELIETIQKINLDSIKDVQVAPEQPNFRGNTLTLSAGFQPKRAGEERPLFTTDKELGFFPIGYRDEPSIPRLNTAAARNLQTTGGVKLVYHGEPTARNLFAFGPKGEDMGSAFSRRVGPNKTEIYTVRASTPELEATLRNELAAQNKIDNTPIVTERPAQFMHSLEGIKKLNQDEIDRQRRGAESETSRLSSYAGSPDVGLVLHSAKLRSTGFITPEQSKQFLEDYKAAKGARAKSDLIETYFGAQFQGGKESELRAHAVKDAEGRIFEAEKGGAHFIAEDRARKEGGTPFSPDATEPGLEAGDEWLRGYTNRRGGFYTRDEAIKQIREGRITGSFPEFEGDATAAAQFQVTRPAEVVPDFRPEEIKGAEVHLPATSYHAAAQGESNPWIRRSADAARSAEMDNADRTLLVQISSDLINPESLAGAKDEATQYYDKLYSGARPGYARMQDFWEIPQWIGNASKFLPNADVYVVRSVAQAREFLKTAGYKNVAFSALDTNKALIRDIVKDYPGKVDIGGYVDPKTFEDLPNTKWHGTMESLAKEMGVPYVEGVDYRHFQGSDVIPRLTMSKGCRHKCAFCSVEKAVEVTPADVVTQQADAIAELGTKLVYLNDKTFGQAANYKDLTAINKQILAKNPDFKGFVIQTTAAQLKVMSPEFLKESGIKFVELGVESYNDPILKEMHKPATESMINQVTDKLRQAGIALIPNIIIGHPSETAATYAKTLKFLQDNKDIISHANIYNLALYRNTELGKKVISISEGDFNENVLEKSFHTNPEIHRQFAGDAYGLAQSMLEGKPSAAQFAPNVKSISEMPKTREELFPTGLYSGQFLPNKDPRAIRTAAIRDPETKKVYEGVAHYDARSKALDAGVSADDLYKFDDGYVTNTKDEFLDRTQAFARANELKQIPAKIADEAAASGFDRGLLSEDLKSKDTEVYPPIKEFTDKLLLTSTEEFNTWVSENKGLTQTAYDAGAKAGGTADLDMLRATSQLFSELSRNAFAAKDYDAAGGYAYKGQAAREAFEYATGKNFNAQDVTHSIKMLRPDYEPHLAPKEAQFAPAKKDKDTAPVFYSRLVRSLESLSAGETKPKTGQQWLGWINRMSQGESIPTQGKDTWKQGISAEEIKWTGLDDALESGKTYTKAQVLDLVKQNAVQVKEVTKTGEDKANADWNNVGDEGAERYELISPDTGETYAIVERAESSPEYPWETFRAETGRRVSRSATLEQAKAAGDHYAPASVEGTKFETYQLPGGENYQELLFTLPTKREPGNLVSFAEWLPEQPWYQTWRAKYKVQGQPGAAAYAEAHGLYNEWYMREAQGRDQATYRGGHWDEPNVVAHTRLNERTDINDSPGLFAEELQSDWHQKGRKGGYAQNTAALAEEVRKVGTALAYTDKELQDLTLSDVQWGETLLRKKKLESQLTELNNKYVDAKAGVPDAPFKNTWHELVLRRLVRMAAEQGKEWLGWTTGEQQATRYDLSKHVDSISWEKKRGELRAYKDATEVIHQNGVNDQAALADYIGKEAAEKLAAQNEINDPTYGTVVWLEGQDLSIGGEGMKGFYDKILVDYANKFGKKFGARVEERQIPGEHDASGNQPPATVHSLPITPQMRESVMREGVAQFSPANKKSGKEEIEYAAVKLDDGRVIKAPKPLGAGEGEAHKDALNVAYYDEGMGQNQDYQDGFTTTSGRFVDRKQGYALAIEANQISKRDYARAEKDAWGDMGTLISDPQLEAVAMGTALRDKEARLEAQRKGIPLGAQAMPLRLPKKVDEFSSEAKGWLSPKGDWYQLPPNEAHEIWARKATGWAPTPGADRTALTASEDLYSRGWIRVVPYGTGSIMSNTSKGRKPTPAQESVLTSDPNIKKVYHDNGNSYGLLTAQFAGKKKDGEDWKLKAAVGGGGEYASSKAWIAPDGTPIQLGGQLHHAYLYQNPEMLKKYGIKVSKDTEDIDIRDGAIKKGFARVDYKISSGALTVEARQKDWPVIAQSVRKLVQENVNKVDAMTVYLYNDAVSKIVDTQSASLFRFSNKEKMENLPLISAPSEVTSMSAQSRAQFAPFPDKGFDAEIEKIRTGKSGGQTFNPSGTIWEAPKSPSDLVSLASVNVPLGKLTREAVEAALAPYADLLDEPGVAAGMFAFSKGGKPTVSIDINAVIDQKHRKNTLDFAKQNDQVSIWDAMINSEVKSGGKGDTKLTTPGEILDALGDLQRGKKVDVPEIIRQNRDVEAGFEQQELLGGKPYVSTANLTKAEIAAKFPEAVIPRNRKEPIQSDVLNSPLAKAAKTTEAAVSAFARKMVEFAREYEAHPSFQSGLKWYSEFVPMLKKKFGKDAPVMAELLAGTSPQQAPTSNYAMALDALEGYKSGRFDKNITGFEKGLDKIKDGSWQKWLNREIASGDFANPPATPTENTFINRWVEKHNLLPRQSNGALYSISSDAVLRILARRWLGNTAGLKTQNFVKNLLGVEHEATIDLWADRTMRRIGYAGSKERWRILPKNATGVTDADFLFAQEVFRRAAKEMNLAPDALQGGLWFAEKQLWADQGWGRLDLGDFRKEIKKTELLKSGIEQRLATQKAAGKAKPVEQLSLDIVQPR